MPTTPTYPGVYIEEIPSSVHTITNVATSIAAFFGQAKEGRVNKAVRILSLADFERTFGPSHPDSELALAVRLFFQNGGTQCYVVRLMEKGTGAKASVVVKTEPSAALADAYYNTDVLRFAAKEIGVWGNQLAMEVDYSASLPESLFNLKILRLGDDGSVKDTEEHLNLSMDPDSPAFAPTRVTQQSKLVDCTHVFASDAAYKAVASGVNGYSQSGRVLPSDAAVANNATNRVDELANLIASANATSHFRISVDGSSLFDVDLEDAFATGVTQVVALAAITTRINQALPSALQNAVTVTLENGPGGRRLLRFTSNTAVAKTIAIQPALAKDATSVLMLGSDNGGIERAKYAVLRPAPTGISLNLTNLNTLANHPQNHFDTMALDGNTIDLLTSLQTTGATDLWWEGKVSATTKNSDGLREKLAIMAKAINDEGIGWTATPSGVRLLLKKMSGPTHTSVQLTTSTNDVGSYCNTNTRYYSLGSGSGTFYGVTVPGVDGSAPTVTSYTGSELEHTGFYALDEVDLFNLMVIPKDASLTEAQYRSLWGPASVYCAAHRAFLIIDPPDSWSDSYKSAVDPTVGINKLRTSLVKQNSAVFYPKVSARDNGLLKNIGPGGAIAGLMARIDVSRGVWKAAAGLEADLRNIEGLEVKLTDMENGVLNKKAINCLRTFPSGIVNWGARTLFGDDDLGNEWKYVPVRRLALMIEESLFRGTKWVVFEPNDEPLWAKIRLNLGAYMMSLFRQGAFQGTAPKEAFFVKCDKETTTQDDINKGIVNIEVGFAPLKPAEFVIIKIQQMAGKL